MCRPVSYALTLVRCLCRPSVNPNMPFLQIKRRLSGILERRNVRRDTSKISEVENTLKSRREIDPRVIDATLSVPREEFVPETNRRRATCDRALSIGKGQTISQPSLVALMISELGLATDASRVLDVGCGSGYQTAILSLLAEHVVAVERIDELGDAARVRLARLGYHNIEVVPASNDVLGCPELGPYDGIIVGASAPDVPQSLVDQLKPGGRMVIPVGTRQRQRVATITRTNDGVDVSYGVECVFVPLIGPEAW